MSTWHDVRRIALALPEVAEATSYGSPAWKVRGALFAWERPLGSKDRADLGDAVPDEVPLGVRVPDLGAKEALLAEHAWCFTIPHFDGYGAVLVRLPAIAVDELRELVEDAWLCRAPKRLAAAYLAR